MNSHLDRVVLNERAGPKLFYRNEFRRATACGGVGLLELFMLEFLDHITSWIHTQKANFERRQSAPAAIVEDAVVKQFNTYVIQFVIPIMEDL